MVIENGSIVASYLRDDVDPEEPARVYSATKSWISFLFGTLVDDGLLSLDETLGDIFPEDDAWADVSDGSTDFRKGATVKELLTMTTGFVDPNLVWTNEWLHGRAGVDDMPPGLPGGDSLQASLAVPKIGAKGQFHYLQTSQIPSYIIMKRTGMTPRQYQAERVTEKLGIGEDEYDWEQIGGVENAYGGLYLTPMQMAKFGQLYLQGGQTSPSNDDRVISQEWIDASFTEHTTTNDPLYLNVGGKVEPYGYLWYQFPSKPTVAKAEGSGGNYICVDRDLGRVVIQQRLAPMDADGNPVSGKAAQEANAGRDEVLNFVVEGNLSFHATNAGLTGMSSESVESE